MKYLLRTLIVLVIAAVAAGFACYHFSSVPELHAAARKGDAMAWLRTDFNLSERQFAEIQRLHEAYAPSCEEHCRMVRQAIKTRDELRKSQGADSAATTEADRALQQLRATCESAITVHVQQVAAVMSPEVGKRYLTLVLPKIVDFDHQVAPDLTLGRKHGH
jgi:methyl-accepting chemotaxis protein